MQDGAVTLPEDVAEGVRVGAAENDGGVSGRSASRRRGRGVGKTRAGPP